jgi:hypothetical protein
MRYPYNNAQWTADYRRRYDQLMDAAPGSRRQAERSSETVRASHLAAVAYADQQLRKARAERGDDRPVDTVARGIQQETGLLERGRDLDGSDPEAGRYERRGGGRADDGPDGPSGPGGGSIRAQIRAQLGGATGRLLRQREERDAGRARRDTDTERDRGGGYSSPGPGPGAQARAARVADGGGIVPERVRRFMRDRAAPSQDVAELAQALAADVQAGAPASVVAEAAAAVPAGAELLAALAASRAVVDPSDDLADVLQGIADAYTPSPAADCGCSTGDPMNANAAAALSALTRAGFDLPTLRAALSPSEGLTGRLALADRETTWEIHRSAANVAVGAIDAVNVTFNKDVPPGYAIFGYAVDPATGNQIFEFTLEAVTVGGDNVYQGPLSRSSGADLSPLALQSPGLLANLPIKAGQSVQANIRNRSTVPVLFVLQMRAQATRAAAAVNGQCSA